MNVRRFTARTSREALVLVRQVLGDDAVVLSTKPSVDGVEVLAMASDGMQQIERMSGANGNGGERASQPEPAPKAAVPAVVPAAARAETASPPVEIEEDVARLSMSTLSFQDYVRERMLRRRQASMASQPAAPSRATLRPDVEPSTPAARAVAPAAERTAAVTAADRASVLEHRMGERNTIAAPLPRELLRATHEAFAEADDAAPIAPSTASRDQQDMMRELRSMKGLIEERFGALAFMEKLNRQPGQARLTQKLLDCGFSPALIRKLGDSLPMDVGDEAGWAAAVLERNLVTAESDAALEDQGGVYALVGATGVGKTTTTAKIAAAFAAKYGAANLGLITLDAYRIGAHEQLRAYGRILGVPVHTAHDRASLEDLLELLAGKKMVLIDTAGMAQRDARTRELLDMLSHRSIRKLLVVNCASQGETIEDVLIAYHASLCAGIVLSKMDEAVKLGPALDALIRMKLKVVGVANGQRVPEDWHRLSANALVHRAMRGGGSSAYKMDPSDLSLLFTAPLAAPSTRGDAAAHATRLA